MAKTKGNKAALQITHAESVLVDFIDSDGVQRQAGGVRACYGESGISRVQSPAGLWFERNGERFSSLADAMSNVPRTGEHDAPSP